MIDMEEEEEEGGGAPEWMATFSDLATLLLTFFILLLSFASMDVTKFRDMMGSMRDAFGVQTLERGEYEAMSTKPVELNTKPTGPIVPITTNEAAAIRLIHRTIRLQGMEKSIDVQVKSDEVVVRIRDQVLFDVGSDRLREEAFPLLDKVIEVAGLLPDAIRIEGHTDSRPIRTSRFPSNWELSASRATAVLRYFVGHHRIPPERLSVAGYADTRPLAPNDSDANRARNRRVEFAFKRHSTAEAAKTVGENPQVEAAPTQTP